MANLVTKDEVKKALNINSFREISGDKIIEFISLIPNMDKDVALAIVNQFPEFGKFSNGIITQLKEISNEAMKSNDNSQKEVITSYNKILDDLSEMSKNENLSLEDKMEIIDKMITVADKISVKDSENKAFLNGMLKTVAPYATTALVLGITLLGVNSKGIKLPSLKK